MNSNKTVTANFTALPALTITATAGTGGTISPSGAVSVNYGQNQSFTVSAGTGYNIDQVLVDGAPVTLSAGAYTFTNVTANHTIAASFTVIPAYTLTINAANGSVNVNPSKTTYSLGDVVTLTASPNTGYNFSSWSGDLSGATNPTTITMNSNKTVTANFTALPALTITATAGTGGTISPSGAVSVNYGQNQSFTVTADTGYNIDQVLVDGAPVTLSAGAYTFTNVTANHTIAASFTDIGDEIIQKSFGYFWGETDNPETGFTRDRVAVDSADRNSAFDPFYNRASMSATGFQLAALCVADADPEVAGGVTHEQLVARATLIMDKLLEIQGNQTSEPSTWALWGRDGFFYHYTDIDTGQRYGDSEVSTIDTAIVVAGAITAGNHFGGTLKDKALQIYKNVNWNAFLDTNRVVSDGNNVLNPSYYQIYHAWSPEVAANSGFYGHWDYTNECMILYMLAIATPQTLYAVPAEAFYSVRRELGSFAPGGKPMVKSWDGALFEYQYTQAFFNFKDSSGDPLYDRQGIDWWDNSVEATKANKAFCNGFLSEFASDADLWGLTSGYKDGFSYGVHGARPAALAVADPDGTVFPAAVGGSLPFLPVETRRALARMKELYDQYDHPIWGDYGFVNSFRMGADVSDTPSPISKFYCGIDVGISLVMAQNLKDGLVWGDFYDFEIEPGVKLGDRIKQAAGLASSRDCVLTVDDVSGRSGFRMGRIDPANTQYTVTFDLPSVMSAPYLLAVHSFMNGELPDHVVNVSVKANGSASFPAQFVYNGSGRPQDMIKYIPIDSANLVAGQNTITLEWQSATQGADWLAWDNIELSSPVENNLWSVARNETVEPKALFGSEYRTDDTYYVGSDISSLEQAVNKDVECFTDILFYTERPTAEYAKLTLDILRTQLDANANLQVFVNGSATPVYSGTAVTSGQIVTPSFELADGWNRITIYHSGVTGGAPAEWVRWSGISLAEANPAQFNPPQALAAASLGPDKINLRWHVVNGIDVRYNIYRSAAAAGPYTKINGTALSSTQYQDTGLADNTTYYYAVTAFTESDPSSESVRSAAVAKKTGGYDVDYRDGRDPNSFGGLSSAQFAYFSAYRHDWTDGYVRRLVLNAGDTAWIGLAGANVNQANTVSIWICGTGSERIDIGLQNIGSATASTVSVTVSPGWQNFKAKLSDFSGVTAANLDKLSVKNASGSAMTVLIDDAAFIYEEAGSATLEVSARNVSDNSVSTGISLNNDNVNTYAPAMQYLKVQYDSPDATAWQIWVYTKNDNGDAAALGGQYNGLMRSDGKARIALLWRAYTDVQAGGVACRTTSDVYSGATMTWNYIKDRNDSDWVSSNPPGSEYSVAAFGRKNEWAYIAPVPPGLGSRSPSSNTFYLYLGADVGSASPGDYSTRIYIDITHA
jgi:hypothetical protein